MRASISAGSNAGPAAGAGAEPDVLAARAPRWSALGAPHAAHAAPRSAGRPRARGTRPDRSRAGASRRVGRARRLRRRRTRRRNLRGLGRRRALRLGPRRGGRDADGRRGSGDWWVSAGARGPGGVPRSFDTPTRPPVRRRVRRTGAPGARTGSSARPACVRARRIAVSISATECPRPWLAPAMREMCSSPSVPPKSLTPTSSAAITPSTPIFTHDAWMFVMCGCRTMRPTAWIFRHSRHVGPVREPPRMNIGVRWWTNGSGTNSVKPPVSRLQVAQAAAGASPTRTDRRCVRT